jgi:ABC-type Fe3+ transport system substrate-binding protein
MSTRQIGRMAILIVLSVFCMVTFLMAGEPAAPKAKAAAKVNLFDELVNRAKEEMAKLNGTLYLKMEVKPDQIEPIFKVFQKDFPFVKNLNWERQSLPEHQMAFLMALKGGKDVRADIRQISRDALVEYRAAGVLEKPPFPWKEVAEYLPKDWGKIVPERFDKEGYSLFASYRTHGITYNHNIIPKEKWPTSWNACVDPYFKGKVLYDSRGPMNGFINDPKLRDWYLDWLKKLVNNGAVPERAQDPPVEKVAAGEYAMFAGSNYYTFMPMSKAMGANPPISFTFGEYVNVELGTEMYFVKGASKAPATGQLFALWLTSKGVPAMDEFAWLGYPLDPRSQVYERAKGKYLALCGPDCFAKAEEYNTLFGDTVKLPGVRK